MNGDRIEIRLVETQSSRRLAEVPIFGRIETDRAAPGAKFVGRASGNIPFTAGANDIQESTGARCAKTPRPAHTQCSTKVASTGVDDDFVGSDTRILDGGPRPRRGMVEARAPRVGTDRSDRPQIVVQTTHDRIDGRFEQVPSLLDVKETVVVVAVVKANRQLASARRRNRARVRGSVSPIDGGRQTTGQSGRIDDLGKCKEVPFGGEQTARL